MRLTLANEITILRILLIAPFVICMLNMHETPALRYAALAIFVVMAASDAIDGYIARIKKQTSRLGAFLDPLADKLLITCAAILLAIPETAVEGYMLPPTVVVLIIGKDLLLSLGCVIIYLITSNLRIVPVSVGKLGTALQLAMVTAILIAPDVHPVFPPWIYLMGFLWWSAAAIAVAATIIYIRRGIRYIEQFEATTSVQA
ncbi:MAG: CDP-alcohol phosphatidyltransferase family protein [Phycisphaerae bacterium]|nr:CDP-alcohol phosphatidyltransferase family protein [Phycisphaerae bacterium]